MGLELELESLIEVDLDFELVHIKLGVRKIDLETSYPLCRYNFTSIELYGS